MNAFLKEELIKTLYKKGIDSVPVLRAMNKIDRHLFVTDAYKVHAYEDVALPILENQTISQPYTVAFMTQVLDVQPGQKILEIGTGSGYQAAVLCELEAKVYSVERIYSLHVYASKILNKLNKKVKLRCGDGSLGWSEFAPFDRIIVTAGAPIVPESLKKQLAIGGKLVIPVGDMNRQILKIITKTSDNTFSLEEVPYFEFVPLIGKEGWEEK